MNARIFIALLYIATLYLEGCNKPDGNHPEYNYVEYYLTPPEKSYMSLSNLKNTITFFDSTTNDNLIFAGNFKFDITQTDFYEYLGPGEMLSIYYNSNTLLQSQTMTINYLLVASSNSDCFLQIEFLPSIGSNGNEFMFDPNDNNKVFYPYINPNQDTTKFYKLLDSINFAAHTFYNVYHLYTTDTLSVIKNCYYTRSQGIVAYNYNNTFWIRSN
jgi:hypothetical protein